MLPSDLTRIEENDPSAPRRRFAAWSLAIVSSLGTTGAVTLKPSSVWAQEDSEAEAGRNRSRSSAVAADLFDQLLTQGLEFPGGTRVAVPEPTILPLQTDSARKQALEQLIQPVPWKRFAKSSVYAPVAVDIDYIHSAAGQRIGHDVHSAFIAYASLDDLRDRDLMESIFGRPFHTQATSPATSESDGSDISDPTGSEGSKSSDPSEGQPQIAVRQLAREELDAAGVATAGAEKESYSVIELPILNQVIIRGVLRVQQHEGPDWIQLSWQLDPRFNVSGQPTNSWTRLERDELGRSVETERQPYSGMGGYLQVVQLNADEKQLLIESRMVIHEPEGWFRGSNFLRSKLPLSLQEGARNFRRKLQAK